MARDTVSTIIDKIRRQLNSTVRLEINVLGASLNATETTVTLTYDLANSIREGAVIDVDSETMRVISVDVAAKEVVVIRGWQDSDAAAHLTAAEVLINPRFTRFDILDGIKEEIDSWAPDLWTTSIYETTTVDDQQVLELTAPYVDAIGVSSVRRNWTDSDSDSWPAARYTLQRGTTSWTAATASGLLIRFTDGSGRVRAGSVMVTVVMPYSADAVTETSDLTTALGMPMSYLELITLGVKARILADDEIGRTARNAQDEPRRNEEVPVGAVTSVAQTMMTRYERKRRNEVQKLWAKHSVSAW